jgi:hypothetical protein
MASILNLIIIRKGLIPYKNYLIKTNWMAIIDYNDL